MRQSGRQGTRTAIALYALLTICLACDATELNDPCMVDAGDAMYEAARMEQPAPRTPPSPGDGLGTAWAPQDEAIRRRRAKHWAKKCVVQHPCPALRALPQCKTASAAVSDFPSLPGALLGQTVSLRGALYVGAWVTTAVGCPEFPLKGCCNAVGSEAILLIGSTKVRLDGLGCGGDDSAQCCDVPAFGQNVVASGTLRTGLSVEAAWTLEAPQLCVDQ